MASEHSTPNADLETENAELRRRLDVAEASLAEIRDESLARRAEVRELAESLPGAVSRQALLRSMARDARDHPAKADVAKRAAAKAVRAVRRLGRAPRKAIRVVRERT